MNDKAVNLPMVVAGHKTLSLNVSQASDQAVPDEYYWLERVDIFDGRMVATYVAGSSPEAYYERKTLDKK